MITKIACLFTVLRVGLPMAIRVIRGHQITYGAFWLLALGLTGFVVIQWELWR